MKLASKKLIPKQELQEGYQYKLIYIIKKRKPPRTGGKSGTVSFWSYMKNGWRRAC